MDAERRRRMGRVFIISGLVMIIVATVIGLGIFPLEPLVRGLLAAALGVAGIVEAVVGLRFLGES